MLVIFALFVISCNKEKKEGELRNQSEVSMEMAEKIASNFSSEKAYNMYFADSQDSPNDEVIRQSEFSGREIETIVPIFDENSEPIYYVINYVGGGFLLLAADFRSIPTLAYSETNTFPTGVDAYPEGLQLWMNFAEDQINEIREYDLESSEDIDQEWLFLIDPDNPDGFVGIGEDPDDSDNTGGNNYDECDPDMIYYGPLLSTQWLN